jgi:hypothetical protein
LDFQSERRKEQIDICIGNIPIAVQIAGSVGWARVEVMVIKNIASIHLPSSRRSDRQEVRSIQD